MLSVKWDLLTFLLIILTVFTPPSIAADQDQTLRETQTLTGRLNILIADNFDTGISQRRFFIRVKQIDGRYRSHPLSFSFVPPDSTLRSGDRVTIQGRLLGNAIIADSIQRVNEPQTEVVLRMASESHLAPLTIGDRKAVVLIVDMNDAVNPYGINKLTEMMYTDTRSVKGLYEASSYQQLSLNPNTDGVSGSDVFGPFEIDHSATENCTMDNPNFEEIINNWATAADAAATSQGIDLTQYQHRIYFLPNEVNCRWVGMGTVRCPDDYINEQNLCRIWTVKSASGSDEGKYLAHELGHNLGWDHSSTDPDNDGQVDVEYGDHSGIMGMPHWAQANAPHRDQMDWFDAYPGSLLLTNCSATIELHALELDPGVDTVGTQVVKIPIPGTDAYYYLSYRRKIGPYPSHDDYANLVNIHRHNGTGGNTLHITNLATDGVFEDTAAQITITATATGGATAAVTVEMPNETPVAKFSHASIDNHLQVQFTNHSTDADDNIASYQWAIDGKTLTDENHDYTFPDSGTYRVTLTVTDDCGGTDEMTDEVIVVANKPPIASFSFVANHLNVQFTDASDDDDGDIASSHWDFGDGATSDEANPNHTYAQNGTYVVTLTITDDDGATGEMPLSIEVTANKPPEANFTSSATGLDVQFTDASDDSDGHIASYQWDFGDGATSTESDPRHIYGAAGTYTVTLTVKDDDGDTDTWINVDFSVSLQNVAPTADFTPRAEKLSVEFIDTSTDSDGTITSHQWEFGDGGTSTETSPNHVYASPDTYAVTLTVTDNEGATDTISKNITVDVNNVPPVAAFTFTADGLEIQFSDTSTDSDGNITSHQWDFGDGGTSTETSPNHAYASPGTYSVALTVTDDKGGTHTATEDVVANTISPLVVEPTPGGGGGGGGGCFIGNLF